MTPTFSQIPGKLASQSHGSNPRCPSRPHTPRNATPKNKKPTPYPGMGQISLYQPASTRKTDPNATTRHKTSTTHPAPQSLNTKPNQPTSNTSSTHTSHHKIAPQSLITTPPHKSHHTGARRNPQPHIAANCTFCCNSITFSRNKLSVSIRSFTVWQEWMTVV
jgi:hypothetical protein